MWNFMRAKRSTPAWQGDLLQAELRSKAEFDAWWYANTQPISGRRAFEASLVQELQAGQSGELPGYCAVCGQDTGFVYDHQYAPAGEVNWRERLLCRKCGLNNRQRLAMHLLRQFGATRGSRIYATEQMTSTAKALRTRYRHVVGSEYLGPTWVSGQVGAQGIRHEDVTALSFRDAQFDWVATFDVLEHVPDFRAALREFARVTGEEGSIILTVPQDLSSDVNIVRAELDDAGRTIHRLPPEYHGDPVNPDEGILCFYHFGWELLRDLRDAGFRNAEVVLSWSSRLGYLGGEQAVIMASKSPDFRRIHN